MKSKYSKYSKLIHQYHTSHPELKDEQIALRISKEQNIKLESNGRPKRGFRLYIASFRKGLESPKVDVSVNSVSGILEPDFGKVEKSPEEVVDGREKKGMETRGDNVVINWTNRTILTDLGNYGNYVCDFNRHNMIQREYVYDGENETGAIVAMKYDFPHTKAVYVYARIHGFSKASVPQTDLEFELGLTEDEAVNENLQRIKRNVYKKTQKKKWGETIDAAEKWWNFENTIFEKLVSLSEEMRGGKVKQLKSIIPHTGYKFASIIGISDVHYMKLCYNHLGELTYDRKISKKRLEDHIRKLAIETSRYGRPEKFFVFVGNDNLHVDGLHHSTTKLTSQHDATDGLFRLEFKNYVQMQIDMIDYYKQIAPITLLPVKGNHDYTMSIALQAFLDIHYKDDSQVTVVTCHDARVYMQYEKVCIMATHGDELGSIPNLERQVHKLIMGEAKNQGINMNEVDRYIILHGHEHVGSTRDLNGNVQRIGLSSMADIDDWWHKEKGYVGRQNESQVIIIDPSDGRKAILYA